MNPTKPVVVLVMMCSAVFAQSELSDENMQTILGYHKECKTETNIDDNVAVGVFSGNFPDDPVLREHILCISKKLGVMDDSGAIQKDVVQTMLSKVVTDDGKVTELTESCAVEKDSPEETAFQMTKCIYEGTH